MPLHSAQPRYPQGTLFRVPAFLLPPQPPPGSCWDATVVKRHYSIAQTLLWGSFGAIPMKTAMNGQPLSNPGWDSPETTPGVPQLQTRSRVAPGYFLPSPSISSPSATAPKFLMGPSRCPMASQLWQRLSFGLLRGDPNENSDERPAIEYLWLGLSRDHPGAPRLHLGGWVDCSGLFFFLRSKLSAPCSVLWYFWLALHFFAVL